MDNPLPTLGMIICYLLWVLLIGPMYMRDRKPMDLRRVIIFYNLFQVLLSGYMFYEVRSSEFTVAEPLMKLTFLSHCFPISST